MRLQRSDLSSFDMLSAGILIIDLKGRIRYANSAAQSMFGKSEKLLCEGVHPVMIDGIHNWVSAYAANPSSNFTVQSELSELHCPPMSPLQVYVTVNPLPDDPEYLLLEITPAQMALQQHQEQRMNELSENTRRLLRNLAHEIKNPLGGIRGAAQLLQSELADPEQREYTEVVIGEADRLQALVDKILAPYRHPYQPVPINVHEILERVRLLIESEFPTGLTVIRDYDISAPDITGDRGQLTQVFLNLMRNAAEALADRMAEGCAEIHLRTRIVHHVFIGQVRYRSGLSVEVSDNGPGVPKDLQESIFYPLVSGKSTGLGLGLSLVQSFVEQHKGSIELKSSDEGTTFTLTFPLSIEKSAKGARAQ